MREFVAALAIAVSANAGATTIVAIWTPQRIVISGDSLLNINWTGPNGAPQHRISNDCKIRKFGRNYVSAAGNYHIQAAGFDVWETAERAYESSLNFEICAARFQS